jgi:ribosome-binding factor A
MATRKAVPREKRLSDELARIVATLLVTEAGDERLQRVNVTGAWVSPDLAIAKVYWNALVPGDEAPAARRRLERALRDAQGFLRSGIATRLAARRSPELVFVYDESVERGRRMEEVIDALEIPAPAEGGEDA